MAQLTLTSALAEYFRRTDNRWQTARQIAAGMDKDVALVRMQLQNHHQRGQLERDGEPRRYRFVEGSLSPKLGKSVGTYSAASAASEFCRRWNVTVPYEATRDNPEALTEWTEMLAR